MANRSRDSFLDLERHRQLLEDNIKKLRDSLRHWQTWEAEYEGFKEEILAASPISNRTELLELGRKYQGDLVDQKEVKEILGITAARTATQVVNLLDRRLDYVERNVRTFKAQLEIAENKLAEATVISTPDARNEEGLPLADIVEELDEEGNVISSHISTPGSAEPQLLEALQKSGIKDIPETDSPTGPLIDHTPYKGTKRTSQNTKAFTSKAVQFTPDTKPGPEQNKSATAKRVEDIVNISKQESLKASEPAIVPTDEAPEDAVLRQEMLQYGLSEVGAVVAELDLEEESGWSDDEYDEDDASSMDDEDEFGRSTGRFISDELRQEMIALEKRLGASALGNVADQTDNDETPGIDTRRVALNGLPPSSISHTPTLRSSMDNAIDNSTTNDTVKKTVRFSENLDIAPDSKPDSSARSTKTAPIGDVVERETTTVALQTSQRKPSRFKGTRSFASADGLHAATMPSKETAPALPHGQTLSPHQSASSIQYQPVEEQLRAVPSGPEGMTLAPNIVERDVQRNTPGAEPNEFDPHLLHQEVATEYHQARNRMIQRQGGFLAEDESEIVPFTEEEGGPKKVSRFKAARLARQ